MKTTKDRSVSLDLLRVLAMLMIVVGHAITHGKAGDNSNGLVSMIISFLNTLSTPATDVFILISGYFLINSSFRFKKLFLLWGQVVFYSVGLFMIMTLVGHQSFSYSGLIKSFFPISFNSYWFFSVYIYLFLLSPFFNILLNHMQQRTYQLFLALGFVLLVIVASIPGINVMNPQAGNGVLWFLMLYSTGGYLYRFPPKHKTIIYSIAFLFFILFAFISKFLIVWISDLIGFSGMGQSRFSPFDSFPIYFAAIACFSAFLVSKFDLRLQGHSISKVIVLCSTGTFGVYLIHEHNSVREWLWQIASLDNDNTLVIIPKAIGISLFVFLVCVIIDLLIWQQIKKILNKINTPKILLKIENIINSNV